MALVMNLTLPKDAFSILPQVFCSWNLDRGKQKSRMHRDQDSTGSLISLGYWGTGECMMIWH